MTTLNGSSRRRVLAVLGLAAVLAGAVVPVVGPTAASAASSAAFSGLAVGDGARSGLVARGYLVTDQPVDSGVPAAQALVDTLQSTAFAAAPYPGAVVLSLPATTSGAVPPFPLTASSDGGTPEAKVEQGPVSLLARSSSFRSAGRAQAAASESDGTSLGSSLSTAEVVHDTSSGDVTAEASNRTSPSTFAGVLKVGEVETTATARGPGSGGGTTTTSSFAARGISVAGQSLELTPKGLSLPGATLPLPASDPVMAVLEQAGVSVRYIAPVGIPDGIQSAGVAVDIEVPLPNAPEPGVLTVTLGRASASASGGGAETPATSGGSSGSSGSSGEGTTATDDVAPPTTGGSDAVPTGPGPAPDVTGLDGPGVSTGDGPAAEAPLPETASGADEDTSAPAGTPGPRTGLRLASSADQLQTASFYLMLVLASVLLLGSTQMLRVFGVRLGWRT